MLLKIHVSVVVCIR